MQTSGGRQDYTPLLKRIAFPVPAAQEVLNPLVVQDGNDYRVEPDTSTSLHKDTNWVFLVPSPPGFFPSSSDFDPCSS